MITVHVDGACRPNPGKGAIGILFSGDKMNYEVSQHLGDEKTTNNTAEYIAMYCALTHLIVHKCQNEEIEIYSDSEMMVGQLTNERGILQKSASYVIMYHKTKELLKSFPHLSIHWIPREQNSEANSLASRAIQNGI